MVFQLCFDFFMKLRDFLPHFGENVFEITLELCSQTNFEFFTIHFDSPPYLNKYYYFKDGNGWKLFDNWCRVGNEAMGKNPSPFGLLTFYDGNVKKLLFKQ